jgi:two-component system response regulator MtrA
MANILVVDADSGICAQIEQALSQDGHQLTIVSTAQQATHIIDRHTPDIVILDAAQNEMLALCLWLRGSSATARLPILCLSAGLSPAEALNIGSDDFIHKPFTAMELAARVRALNRWAQRQREQPAIPRNTLRFEPTCHTVYLGDKAVSLTHTEYKLLELMAQQPGVYISIGDLLQRVWKYPEDQAGSALVRNHICNLRSKIERDPQRPSLVLSQHGRGYGLSSEVRINN